MKLAVTFFALALLCFAQPKRLLVLDETVEVPAADWRAFDLDSHQRPLWIECDYAVERGGSGVRLLVLRHDDVERMRNAHPHRVLGASGFERSGSVRVLVPAGDYSLVVDNRLEGRGPADVHLRVHVTFLGPAVEPRVLSPMRRFVVVMLSAIFFIAVAWIAGRKLLRAARENRGAPPPAFWG